MFCTCIGDLTIVMCSLCLQHIKHIKSVDTIGHLGTLCMKRHLNYQHLVHLFASCQEKGCIPPSSSFSLSTPSLHDSLSAAFSDKDDSISEVYLTASLMEKRPQQGNLLGTVATQSRVNCRLQTCYNFANPTSYSTAKAKTPATPMPCASMPP